MFERIVVPLEDHHGDRAALDVAQDRARQYGCPIHVIRFVDVSHLVRIGCHGPAMDVTAYRMTLPAAHEAARDHVAAVANALTARGFQVTHEVRQGLLRFELPAAMLPGDLIVTTVEADSAAVPHRADTAHDPIQAGDGLVVITVGPADYAYRPPIPQGRDPEECESFELPRRSPAHVAPASSSRR